MSVGLSFHRFGHSSAQGGAIFHRHCPWAKDTRMNLTCQSYQLYILTFYHACDMSHFFFPANEGCGLLR
jgi:hypothetical protein